PPYERTIKAALNVRRCRLMEAGRMDSGMQLVIELFPELAASIQDRFQDDESFREICNNYAETLETLQRWEASHGPYRAARIEEYRELAEGLEIEIVAVLRSTPTGTKHDRA
ncbi:MAG TPA: hypothetical protein VLE23_12810, partial [Geminicoccaceae bacterium]|nr:hypothetical protein [Geminicoccaceae bacterium]